MKNINNQDERIISQKMRIHSDAYQILVYCLLISIVIQQFFLKAPLSQFIVEFFCLIGVGIYIIVRYLTDCIDIWNPKALTHKNILFNAAGSGAITVILTLVLAGERNIWKLVILFLCFTSFNFIVTLMFRYINNKRKKQLNDKLDSDE